VDAVGAVGRVPMPAEALGIDLVSLAGNDLYGPPGVGALWARPGVKIAPLSIGAGQEGGYRAGTENLPGIVGLGVAAELMRAEAGDGELTRITALRDALRDGILRDVPDCRLTGPARERLPQHVSVVVRDVRAESVLMDLDLAGVAAASGAACMARTGVPSHVLRAIRCDPAELSGSLCFTLGRWTTAAEVAVVVERLPGVVGRLRALAGAP
jgi:cysteine desulfurase